MILMKQTDLAASSFNLTSGAGIVQLHPDMTTHYRATHNDTDTIDFRLKITANELEALIGTETIRSLYNSVKEFNHDMPISRIVLRRTYLNGDTHIRFHEDGDRFTMHVWLNEIAQGGGVHVFLTENGPVGIEPKVGAALLHSGNIIHGTTAFNGTRDILVFVGDDMEADDVFEGMFDVKDETMHVLDVPTYCVPTSHT